MDIVDKVRECLKMWTRGGDAECRNVLIAPHCNPTDPANQDILTTAYHTLLWATLLTWTPSNPLTPTAFVDFVQSVLSNLPSSSTVSPKVSPQAVIFGDYLVDMIWAVDTELDEMLNEARVASTASGEQGKLTSREVAILIAKAKKAQQNAESDKQRIPVIVKKLLECRVITVEHCRERLESAVLASVGLIQDKGAQDKKEIRTRTGLFYKQNKFNLLREQSEGYSKLTVELTSSLGPPHSPHTGRPSESYALIEERARPVWEKVISLIGYFDLDPNRALDVILDVLSQHLATHYSFFLALLSLSPWAGSYRRPVPEAEVMDTKAEIPVAAFKGKSLEEVLTLVETDSTHGTFNQPTNPDGARVLAQVLGFKFSYYQSADVSESVPRNLYLAAAILIREGFITLEDLYPHLSLKDEGMDTFKQEYASEVQARIAGAKNSMLAMAAPLESGTSSSQSKSKAPVAAPEPKKAEVKDNNQKAGLLISLLSVGALKPAIAIMTKFPWLVDARPEIADLMIRVMKVSLSSLYESALITKERNPSFTRPRARYGPSGVNYPSPRKPLLTLWAPAPPSTSTTDFVFFFPDWVDRIPICSSLDDLEDVIEPLMRFVGLHISRDPLFLTKFLRLARLHLQPTIPVDPVTKKPIGEPDPENPIRKFWFNILRRYLLPALPLIRGNAVCTVEVWNIIRQYETTARWRLYGEWKTNTYHSHPELRIREVQADRESKGILRRLSHNTIDSLSGPVAKLAHSNPCIFFTNAVNQIMAYDNLANVVIQALRYVTNMGFDVLVFIILNALSNPDKERVKDDGVNISDWLQSLASFTGMLFRRYSADLTPVLKYVVHQLHNGQTTEIVVLRELIWKMAGIEPLPSLSESQMAAMAGGPALRIEAIASATRGSRLDPGDAILKGPQRLGKGLLESSLALPLLIQVAQQRQACVYKAPNAHLKSLAGLYDATHGVLLQYLELLTSPSVVLPEDYASRILPSLAELGEDYGICPPICMEIMRPVLHSALLKSALAMQEQERIASELAEKRLKAALTAKREPNSAVSRLASPAVGATAPAEVSDANPPVEETEATMDVDAPPVTSGQKEEPPKEEAPKEETRKEESPWVPELTKLFDDVKRIAPGNAFEVIGPGFYLTFWQLSTYDLTPPGAKYDEEAAKLKALSRQEDSKYISAERSSDRAKRATAGTHRTRRDRYNTFITILTREFKEQTISRAYTLKRLAREKQHWFAHSTRSASLMPSIIEHCIQPRCLLSPMDADFCSQFIKVIHLQGTPGFHTLGCYDKMLGDHVKVVLFTCSEYEARNYGRFLLGVLRDLLTWHLDEAAFIQDNRAKVAGKTVILPGFLQKWSSKAVPTAANILKWSEFQQIVRKWHRKIAKCFIDCIQTGEFMHVYNAIVVLKEILEVFPLASVNEAGPSLNAAIDRLIETEERGDLKILARSYSASLKKKEVDWTPVKPPAHINGTNSPRPPINSTSSPVPEKPRNVPPPTGPVSQTASSNDARRNATQPPPSAPRAQLTANSTPAHPDSTATNMNSTKLAMDSIPRPEVVKRVRPDPKAADSPKPTPEPLKPETNDRRPADVKDEHHANNRASQPESPRHPREIQNVSQQNGPPSNAPEPPRFPRPLDQLRGDSSPVMPPPIVPSQTASAQELRETARQTIGKSERSDTRSHNGSAAPSPRIRSPSPPTRPGTRNASNESRTSGGKSRSDPGNPDRGSDDRRPEIREPIGNIGRRDSLTHNRTERSSRDRGRDDKDRDADRDRDRGRDRHGDRERDRDRDRDREREREREREKDRDRDRHRRDEKDRDRDRDSRKEREAATNRSQAGTPSTSVPDERNLLSRPDTSRHRGTPQNNGGDDGLGKRRRPTEDDPERSSKRSSRKDGHRDDRGRRPPEKDSHERPPRESDRRRKDREAVDVDHRASSAEKVSEKRPPEAPANKALPNAPSAPRADRDTPRAKVDPVLSSRDRHRDAPPAKPQQSSSTQSIPQEAPPVRGGNLGSLRSRISNQDPVPSSSHRSDGHRYDSGDLTRKRTAGDRDVDMDPPSGPSNEPSPQPSKRIRTGNSSGDNRRFSQRGGGGNNHGIARRFFGSDPAAIDKHLRRQD
ncbi:unnamed protein product [Cyclocybe aegerita]|uniref:THO complex subunit 2 n=1 Tax=Cyclocybe aegerita TaxID=1973307 RepID=A0A8S0W2X0_CYCAE|nr:unnamed protein product [Cyclocybe aegerita]